MKNRIISVMLVLAMVLGMVPLVGIEAKAAEVASGSCGDNLTWVFDMEGNLTISGSGAMTDFGPSYAANVSTPWNAYRADIKTVTVHEGVTGIGSYAFTACSNLERVILSAGLTHIGENAFFNCTKLSELALPDGLLEIGEYAFHGCQRLSSVVIPGSLTEIADHAFESCVALTEMVIPEGVTAIGYHAFKYCPGLTRIVLPESITSVGRGAFEECGNLGHILYTGTQAQWAAVTLRSGALPDGAGILCEYVDGMDYHVYDSGCDSACNLCGFTRAAAHSWSDGVTNEDTTVTYVCTACGDEKVEGTPVMPTKPIDPTEPVTQTPTSAAAPEETVAPPETNSGRSEPGRNGNGTVVAVAVAALLLACGGAAAWFVLKKKKQ